MKILKHLKLPIQKIVILKNYYAKYKKFNFQSSAFINNQLNTVCVENIARSYVIACDKNRFMSKPN
jgi:hypothetical protein